MLQQALLRLDEAVEQDRALRLEALRKERYDSFSAISNVAMVESNDSNAIAADGIGIDRNDPILAWSNLHQRIASSSSSSSS